VGDDEARDLRHGKRIDGGGRLTGAVAAAIDPEGRLIGVVEKRGTQVKSVMNMPEEAAR
jgi:tRNA pseudouridine55 synthase